MVYPSARPNLLNRICHCSSTFCQKWSLILHGWITVSEMGLQSSSLLAVTSELFYWTPREICIAVFRLETFVCAIT